MVNPEKKSRPKSYFSAFSTCKINFLVVLCSIWAPNDTVFIHNHLSQKLCWLKLWAAHMNTILVLEIFHYSWFVIWMYVRGLKLTLILPSLVYVLFFRFYLNYFFNLFYSFLFNLIIWNADLEVIYFDFRFF